MSAAGRSPRTAAREGPSQGPKGASERAAGARHAVATAGVFVRRGRTAGPDAARVSEADAPKQRSAPQVEGGRE